MTSARIAAAVLVVLPAGLRILPSISTAAAGITGGIAIVAALRPG